MELTESTVSVTSLRKYAVSTKISYNGMEIDLGKPFARITMIDAVKKYAGVDFERSYTDEAAAREACRRASYRI